MFGLKAFPLQLEEVYRINPHLIANVMKTFFPRGQRARVVELRRRDRTAHAISVCPGAAVGHLAQGAGTRRPRRSPRIRPKPLARAARMIEQQEAAWQAMYRDLRVEPLVIWLRGRAGRSRCRARGRGGLSRVALDPAAAVDGSGDRAPIAGWRARMGGASRGGLSAFRLLDLLPERFLLLEAQRCEPISGRAPPSRESGARTCRWPHAARPQRRAHRRGPD